MASGKGRVKPMTPKAGVKKGRYACGGKIQRKKK